MPPLYNNNTRSFSIQGHSIFCVSWFFWCYATIFTSTFRHDDFVNSNHFWTINKYVVRHRAAKDIIYLTSSRIPFNQLTRKSPDSYISQHSNWERRNNQFHWYLRYLLSIFWFGSIIDSEVRPSTCDTHSWKSLAQTFDQWESLCNSILWPISITTTTLFRSHVSSQEASPQSCPVSSNLCLILILSQTHRRQ